MARKLSTRTGTFLTAAAVALLSATGAQAEYRVAAFLNAPGFDAIMEGDYDSAARNGAMRAPVTAFGVNTNLCVSQLMSESLTEALESCNKALRQLPERSPLSMEARRANESVVLSNRGVVLAMQGNLLAAEEDFVRALKLDDENANAEANLSQIRSLKMSLR